MKLNLCFYYFFVLDCISYSNVKVFKHLHVTLISLNRPDDKNKLNLETINNLKKAVSNFENDCLSTIAILYGEGGSFCAGFDPEELPEALPTYNVTKTLFHLFLIS